MPSIVQARLDTDSQAALDRLTTQLGWSPSKVVREALKLLAERQKPSSRPKVIGVGRFDSGISDLGSNKKHLSRFGQ
jgi:hypothetical protein